MFCGEKTILVFSRTYAEDKKLTRSLLGIIMLVFVQFLGPEYQETNLNSDVV
jgi:hypothetical protein